MFNIGFENYGNYSSDNYGAHTLRFMAGTRSYWFSYKTLVAFYHPTRGLVVHENTWGPTTGKHLNWIDGGDKKSRVNAETFKRLLEEAEGGNDVGQK